MARPIKTTASERDVESPITQSRTSMDHLRIEKTTAVGLAVTVHFLPPDRADEFPPHDRPVFAFARRKQSAYSTLGSMRIRMRGGSNRRPSQTRPPLGGAEIENAWDIYMQ
jgi:hypothetical protein